MKVGCAYDTVLEGLLTLQGCFQHWPYYLPKIQDPRLHSGAVIQVVPYCLRPRYSATH